MGEESTEVVYIGKHEDGEVKFYPLTEIDVEVGVDLAEEESTDITAPLPSIRTLTRDKSLTITGLLCRKGLKKLYKGLGVPKYLRTEFLFPKKKNRGTARRKRYVEIHAKDFARFIHNKYGGTALFSPLPGLFEGEDYESD